MLKKIQITKMKQIKLMLKVTKKNYQRVIMTQ